MVSLCDIQPLGQIRTLCEKLDIELIAHGGLVTRALIAASHQSGSQMVAGKNLFQLTPFTCDIDVIHTGAEGLTARIVSSFFHAMPAAECFRWEFRAIEELKELHFIRNIIPARSIMLSTKHQSAPYDPHDGLRDIRRRRFRLLRHPQFSASPAFRAYRDLEVFSALLYLRLLSEAKIGKDELERQPGLKVARKIFSDCQNTSMIMRLQESSYLRMRFLYLLQSLESLSNPSIWELVLEQSGLGSFLAFVAKNDGSLNRRIGVWSDLGSYNVRVISAHIGGDLFRAPGLSKWRSTGELDPHKEILRRSVQPPQVPSDYEPPNLVEDQVVLAMSESIRLHGGHSESSQIAGHVQEFIHFDVSLPVRRQDVSEFINPASSEGIDSQLDEHLSLLIGLNSDDGWKWLPLPTCATIVENADSRFRVLIRTNAYGLLQTSLRAEPASSEVDLRAVLIGLRKNENDDALPLSRFRLGGWPIRMRNSSRQRDSVHSDTTLEEQSSMLVDLEA